MSLLFEEHQRTLWPALHILGLGREEASPALVIELVKEYFQAHRFRADEEVAPGRLKSPASPEDVINWLYDVWRRLESAERSELLGRRRFIMDEIVASGLPAVTQSNLLTALDYLARLASARKVARVTRPSYPVSIPPTNSPLMKATYAKLVGLAATDLPMWLVGEKGVELEWLASVVHRLRSLPEASFHVWDFTELWSDSVPRWWHELEGPWGGFQDTTFVVKDVEEAPERVQRLLSWKLVRQMTEPSSARIIVISRSVVARAESSMHMTPELAAFLNPTRVEVPPLRSRVEDIPELIRHLLTSRGREDPLPRMSKEALDLFRKYHWPGNVEELELTVNVLLATRPRGPIRAKDLPQCLQPEPDAGEDFFVGLAVLMEDERFRVLQTEEGRRKLAQFLSESGDRKFGAAEIQGLLSVGRETARRLLQALESHGILEAFTGSGGQRVTRYRRVCRPKDRDLS